MSDEQWLAATWPFVQANLPTPPARVVELGCGPLGGFVPRMRALGHDAIGVDPTAPADPWYEQIEFEQLPTGQRADVVVASTSLHHVADLDLVLDRIRTLLSPAGTVVVVEWAHERFDEPTARWCFDRLAPADENHPDHHSWLHTHRDDWQRSGQSWTAYFEAWQGAESLHPGSAIVSGLGARFRTGTVSDVPHFFADLDDVSESDEQGAIDAGLIQANGIHFVGYAQ
jgi:SAM-dependent methyltransferase